MHLNHILRVFVITFLGLLIDVTAFANDLVISKKVFSKAHFSSQFIEDGALIRNINFEAVNALIPQLNKIHNIELQDRGESHITVITPPEAQGWFTPDRKGINYLISSIELHHKYFPILQNSKFEIVCVGKRENDQGNIVFYLVLNTPDLLKVRKEIQSELESRAEFTGKNTSFEADKWYPHITIGYIGGDVHGVSKGPETCVHDLQYQ